MGLVLPDRPALLDRLRGTKNGMELADQKLSKTTGKR